MACADTGSERRLGARADTVPSRGAETDERPHAHPGADKRPRGGDRDQSPTTRRPKTMPSSPTYCTLPVTFRRIVVGLAKKSSAWAGVRP
jgi:hypothetical protein